MQKREYINKNIYDNILINCPLCNSSQLRNLYKIDRYDPSFMVDTCDSCGFIFMNPPFSDETIAGFYQKDYFEGNAQYSYYDERKAKQYACYVWDKRIQVLRKHVPNGNLLDVGASFGGLLERAGQYFSSYGIEFSSYAAAHAREIFGEKIHNGTLTNHPFRENFFSAITMIELIEHLKDPVTAVEECHRLLKDNGVLVIQTANMRGVQARLYKSRYAYFMPGHLSYFSAKNLKDLLLAKGFSKVKILYPVEFGLWPKLAKSAYNFRSLWDYRHWIRISLYHFISKIHFRNFAMTSSMVVYARK